MIKTRTIGVALGLCAALLAGSAAAQSTATPTSGFGGDYAATITRPANTTQYTANTGWANATSGATYSTFSNVCRLPGATLLYPSLTVIDFANQTTKLSGYLWFFKVAPTSPISDNATFNISAADLANMAGDPIPFTISVVANQNSGAAGSAIGTIAGTTYELSCASGSQNLYMMVEVTNTYTPVSAEQLTIKFRTVGVN